MTDRYHTLTVTLAADTRTDDAEALIGAIRMMRGVADVSGIVADPTAHMAEVRVRRELGDKLWAVLHPK